MRASRNIVIFTRGGYAAYHRLLGTELRKILPDSQLHLLAADRQSLRIAGASFEHAQCLTELMKRHPMPAERQVEGLVRLLDEEMNGCLNRFLLCDRMLEHRDPEWVYQRAAHYYIVVSGYLEHLQPAALLLPELTLFLEIMLLELGRRRGVEVRIPQWARLPGRISLTSDLSQASIGFQEAYERRKREGLTTDQEQEVANFEDLVLKRGQKPAYVRLAESEGWRARKREIRKLGEWWQRTRDYVEERPYIHYRWMDSFTGKLMKTWRHMRNSWRLHNCQPVAGETFFLFPLQVHPESSTSTSAPFYCNQAAVVENVAKCLPAGVKLYVKEHTPALAGRSGDFYCSITALKNVRLIEPRVPISRLITESAGVITITSTAGFEALVAGKPVVTFGDSIYAYCDDVYRPANFEEVPAIVEEILKRGGRARSSRREFLSALAECSWAGSLGDPFYLPETLSPSNITATAGRLAVSWSFTSGKKEPEPVPSVDGPQ